MTPGSTSAWKSPSLISKIRFIRVKSSTKPHLSGIGLPSKLEPEPQPVIGIKLICGIHPKPDSPIGKGLFRFEFLVRAAARVPIKNQIIS